MKIERWAAQRNHGSITLAPGTDPGTRSKDAIVEWNGRAEELYVWVYGVKDGNMQHRYKLSLTADEVAQMVERMTAANIDEEHFDRTTEAIGKGMAAFLRARVSSALPPPNK